MGNRGKREFIQVLRLMEAIPKEIVAGAVRDAIRLGAIGFDAVKQIVLVRGVVNAAPDFIGHTQVIDAASEVFVDVFGEAGRHARLAVGMSSLPANIALEIEVTVEVAR